MNIDNAVLSLVRMHPDSTGYQMKAIFDNSPGHIVPLHLSQIYPALKRLTENGLVSCREVPQQGRLPQKFYSITQAGEEELDRWFSEPFEFGPNRDAFDEYLLMLGSMSYMSDERVAHMLDQGIDYLEGRLAVESDAAHVQTGLDYITPSDAREAERYKRMFKLEYDLLENETRTRLAWLRDIRKSLD